MILAHEYWWIIVKLLRVNYLPARKRVPVNSKIAVKKSSNLINNQHTMDNQNLYEYVFSIFLFYIIYCPRVLYKFGWTFSQISAP